MNIFGLEITRRRKQMMPYENGYSRGWLTIGEPYAGAWQRNDELPVESVLSNTTVYRCITLIAADIAKMRLRLMREDANGIGQEITAPAFSPLLETPNHYQNSIQFFEQWMFSKLIAGNTYVLKGRDGRNVIDELYVLDPNRVRPLVAPDRSVFYELRRDDLSGLNEQETVTVPASEIIHDRMNALYHPLWGISPIYANNLPAKQALRILKYSDRFFGNAARPSGVLTAPGVINKETAERLKSHWESNYTHENAGRVAVLGDGLKFEAMTQNAVDAELLGQLELSDKKVCTSFGVPAYKVGVESAPAYDNIEALDQQYYSNCLQTHIECIERLLLAGIELPPQYYVEFDLDGLLRMDTPRLVKSIADAVGAAVMTPNEGRKKLGLKPVTGGDSPMIQQQNYSLEAIFKRDTQADPFAANKPVPINTLPSPTNNAPPAKELHRALKVIRGGLT